ncbi:MAG TPA: hypothetical protein VIH96_12400 [Paraburkholderia sp.]|jgi:hypothetical protein
MQIGAATQFANGSANMSTGDTSTASDQAAQDAAQASDNSTNATSSSSQDDAVQISPQGYAAASSDDTGNGGDASSGDSASQTDAQPVKSLVYGALGLERPDQPDDPNQAYTLGHWIAAGITLGGIISLFI